MGRGRCATCCGLTRTTGAAGGSPHVERATLLARISPKPSTTTTASPSSLERISSSWRASTGPTKRTIGFEEGTGLLPLNRLGQDDSSCPILCSQGPKQHGREEDEPRADRRRRHRHRHRNSRNKKEARGGGGFEFPNDDDERIQRLPYPSPCIPPLSTFSPSSCVRSNAMDDRWGTKPTRATPFWHAKYSTGRSR